MPPVAVEEGLKWLRFDFTDRIGLFLFDKLAAGGGRNVYLVQVGANDGTLRDPVGRHARRHDWSGLVIEPVDELFAELCATYRDFPRIECAKAVCSDRAGQHAFYRIRYRNGQPVAVNKGLSSIRRDVVRGHFDSEAAFADNIAEIIVDVVPLEDLLRARNIAQVDLLVIDTEGADLTILKGFDLTKYAPKLVMIEHYHLAEHERHELYEIMCHAGYERAIGAMDTFFWRQGFLTDAETATLAPFRWPLLAWTWSDNHLADAKPRPVQS